MVDLTISLPPNQARALAEMARHFQYGDAQHLLRASRNVTADSLCEAVTGILDALIAVGTGTVVESGDRVTVTFDIDKADQDSVRRFVETLLAATAPQGT